MVNKLQKNSGLYNEKVWEMPRSEKIRKAMKGGYSDLINSRRSPYGGSTEGAEFLSYFVEEGVNWTHLDIAGVANNEKLDNKANLGFGSGWGVATLMNYFK